MVLLLELCVVYLLIPTSNHNLSVNMVHHHWLYIFWFLHQTTTVLYRAFISVCCISFDSYIKPQQFLLSGSILTVVYLLIPTSNHNIMANCVLLHLLYIFWFLHQTTTPVSSHSEDKCCISFDSYIKPQLLAMKVWLITVVYLLIPTSNHNSAKDVKLLNELYIFWFLHQTTTFERMMSHLSCCISFDSYIKPQLSVYLIFWYCVVYLLIPTSNHNNIHIKHENGWLYIFWFLHQTTTMMFLLWLIFCCISFDSYIKPQLLDKLACFVTVVYLLIPTSNHNIRWVHWKLLRVVYLLIPTSNHNS